MLTYKAMQDIEGETIKGAENKWPQMFADIKTPRGKLF